MIETDTKPPLATAAAVLSPPPPTAYGEAPAVLPVPVPSMQLGLLGGFSLNVDGRAVELPVHAQRLLVFLALCGRASRVLTAGTLWPEVGEQRALGNLRSTVWRLQRLCPSVLSVSRNALLLTSSVQVDVRECTARLGPNGARPPLDDLITGRFCGDLLPGWYEDWVIRERDQLLRLRLLALEEAAEQLLQLGRYHEALGAALTITRSDPLRESACRLVLQVHIAEDNRVEALRHFRTYRELLATELGTEPSPRTWAVLNARA